MPEHVLDTVVLQAMTFSDPDGIEILLQGRGVSHARFPAEVYNRDEGAMPLDVADEDLSEFARGLRYASRQVRLLPAAQGERYVTWLRNANQLADHLVAGRLRIDPLTVQELPRRDELIEKYGIGRGEAACITLVERYHATGIFLSSDEEACAVAQQLGLPFATVPDILKLWVRRGRPPQERLDALLTGLRAARFGLKAELMENLRQILLGQV